MMAKFLFVTGLFLLGLTTIKEIFPNQDLETKDLLGVITFFIAAATAKYIFTRKRTP